jgi:glutamine cyclotransferase
MVRIAAWFIAAVAALSPARAIAAVPEYSPVIVHAYPHDPRAFTEGLLYHGGTLYESTGRNGQSSVREVKLRSGKVLRSRDLGADYFGEGIAVWGHRLVELTWKSQIGFVYDLNTFRPLSSFHYEGEGWALTQDGAHLIMSDGSSDLRLLDPGALRETGRVHVTCEGRAIRNINELEWVKGEIYANVWLTNVIVRIDPASGEIVGLVDLTDLAAATVEKETENVPNGIAYDAAGDRLFVTGKLWPKLYQITLSRRTTERHLCDALPG